MPEIMRIFAPCNQERATRDKVLVHFGKAPSLGVLALAHGENEAHVWLSGHLAVLSEFAGVREKLNDTQYDELSRMLLKEYGHWKLTEFMDFIQRCKTGRYGQFYGVVDPMLIMQWAGRYAAERAAEITAKEIRDEEEERLWRAAELEQLRRRYERRVPGAYTPGAAMTFTQYRLMGYDAMDDRGLEAEMALVHAGRKTLPSDPCEMIKQAFVR